MTPVEICINSQSTSFVFDSVSSAWQAGANRIELCANMAEDGLTPAIPHIEAARAAFHDRPGVLVMIRPVPGGFFYSDDQIQLMARQINDAARAGADGVVIGALDSSTGRIHTSHCRQLIEQAKSLDLQVTFHRAFDATADWQNSLEILVTLGADRVLSSGTQWGTNTTALDGVDRLADMVAFTDGSIEIVVGGGVNEHNAPLITSKLCQAGHRFSLHAYSAVLQDHQVSQQKIQHLIQAARSLF